MKKLYVVLGVLFTLSVAALPAKADSGDDGRKAVCKWAQEHNMQASETAASVCGELGVELVAKAGVSGGSAQDPLVAEAERLRAIADEKSATYTAAIHARQAAYHAKDDYAVEHNCFDGYHNAGRPSCSDDPAYQELAQAYQDARDAEDAAMFAYYEADDAARDAEIEAGLREPNPCIADPSLPQCNVK